MLRLVGCLIFCAILPLHAAPLTRPYTVENYDVKIRIDLANQRVSGEAAIRLHSLANDPISALEFDAGGKLDVAAVTEAGLPQSAERDRNLLLVVLRRPLRPDESRTITVQYQAGSAAGLKFISGQAFATNPSDWMPCNDRSGEHATLHLTIDAPADAKIVASGRSISASEWQIDQPTEPSLFGFAAGSFTELTGNADGISVRVLGGSQTIVDSTAAVLRSLGELTGKHYPAGQYTEVLTHIDAPHVFAGLAILPDSYSSNDLSTLADTIAHQWYGVAVAPQNWSDAWLSEGLSRFVADEFLEKRSGKQAFDAAIAHSREFYRQLAAVGKDHPLSNNDWTSHQDAAGALSENKGVSFFYLVRQMMGDNAFQEGLHLYTSAHWEQTATSEDLQAAFDAASGNAHDKNKQSRDKKSGLTPLDNLFDQWVYGILNTKGKRR